MKIISKYKDYYDYFVGAKYGIDNHVVLDRREGYVETFYSGEVFAQYDDYSTYKLAICDTMYVGKFDNRTGVFTWVKDKPTSINQEENCPIVFVSGYINQQRRNYPCLREFKIASVYPADEIYQDIYNWILKSKENNIKDNRTNVEKLQSAGFDKRTSFRH